MDGAVLNDFVGVGHNILALLYIFGSHFLFVMTHYTPGLHLLATFKSDGYLLSHTVGCKEVFDALIVSLALTKTGEVYHTFDNGGFTASVCLTESHVSIHTWPEYNLATFDVFLSNFRHDNSDKVRHFYEETIQYFNAEVLTLHEIIR